MIQLFLSFRFFHLVTSTLVARYVARVVIKCLMQLYFLPFPNKSRWKRFSLSVIIHEFFTFCVFILQKIANTFYLFVSNGSHHQRQETILFLMKLCFCFIFHRPPWICINIYVAVFYGIFKCFNAVWTGRK